MGDVYKKFDELMDTMSANNGFCCGCCLGLALGAVLFGCDTHGATLPDNLHRLENIEDITSEAIIEQEKKRRQFSFATNRKLQEKYFSKN